MVNGCDCTITVGMMGGPVTFVAAIVCCGTILLCSYIEGGLFDVNSAVAVTVGMFAIPITGINIGLVIVTGKTTGYCTGIVAVTVFEGADTVTKVELFTQSLTCVVSSALEEIENWTNVLPIWVGKRTSHLSVRAQ